MALPVIATTGVVLRDQANQAAAPTSASFGTVPQRSEILDANGHLMAYVYGVDGGPGASASGIDSVARQLHPDLAGHAASGRGHRGQPLLAGRRPGRQGHPPRAGQQPAAQGGAGRFQHHPAVRQEHADPLAPNAQQASAASQDTPSRKLHEIVVAITVAHQQSKQQILAGYLNDAYFGNLAYGIEVAAETYFNTSAAKLTLPQAALLAGMVENPTGYDPFTNASMALARRKTALATGPDRRAEQHDSRRNRTVGRAGRGTRERLHAEYGPLSGVLLQLVVEQVVLQDSSIAKTTADPASCSPPEA